MDSKTQGPEPEGRIGPPPGLVLAAMRKARDRTGRKLSEGFSGKGPFALRGVSVHGSTCASAATACALAARHGGLRPALRRVEASGAFIVQRPGLSGHTSSAMSLSAVFPWLSAPLTVPGRPA
ncbi:MAG: hypothetical protein LBR80_02035 [Deltaproteobacteria bacterium]|nr:hypothetical protein [Deltaproteobacteria bacterium]